METRSAIRTITFSGILPPALKSRLLSRIAQLTPDVLGKIARAVQSAERADRNFVRKFLHYRKTVREAEEKSLKAAAAEYLSILNEFEDEVQALNRGAARAGK